MVDKRKPIFEEYSDEAFAEIEEHLVKIRKNTLDFENYIDAPEIDEKLLQDFLISFHTLKGICGMMGMPEAENLSHQVEFLIKRFQKKETLLSRELYEIFFNAVKVLENIISLTKSKELDEEKIESFELNELTAQLSNGLNEEKLDQQKTNDKQTDDKQSKNEKSQDKQNGDNHLKAEKNIKNGARKKIIDAINSGESVWKIEFTPTQELFKSGVNVTIIRKFLEELGEIVSSTPSTKDGGKISFEFYFILKQDEAKLRDYEKSGLKLFNLSQEKVKNKVVKEETKNEGHKEKLKKQPESKSFSISNIIRVDISKLDELMRIVGDLVISRSKLEEALSKIELGLENDSAESLSETNEIMERQIRDLREGIMRVRLIQIGEVFDKMQFVIRDLIRESKKTINLKITGKETEIDKYVVERILDPLLHLVRNSVSHGLETNEERKQKGKTEQGNIWLNAFTSGDSVIIEIKDDGRGIDRKAIKERAIQLGLIKDSTEIDDSALMDIICSPGFSTKEKADRASGRGVGMTVVRNTISELGGILSLETEENKYTKFTLQIPLTLAIVNAVIVSVAGQRFAIPQPNINEVIQFNKSEVNKIEMNEFITHRDKILPLIRLYNFFNLDFNNSSEIQSALIIGATNNNAGLVVDQIIDLREIVVRTFIDPYVKVNGVVGATELGDGKPILILDGFEIIREWKNKANKIKII